MKFLYIILALLVPLNVSYGQETNKSGTTAAQFLKIGVGSRATAMSGAIVGLVDDATATYWNPSGLVGVKKITVIANVTDWFLDVNHQNFAIVFPIDGSQNIALSATILSMDKMEVTTERKPNGTGTFFEASDISIGLTYAVQIVDFFSFGITGKFINQNIYKESATAFAIDLGTTLTTGYKGISIGMSFLNFGTALKLEGPDLQKSYDANPNNATNTGVASNLATEHWALPLTIKVGIGWNLISNTNALMWSEMHKLKIGIDANHPIDAPEYISFGTEYGWHNTLFLRGGYSYNDGEKDYSLGTGIRWSVANNFVLNFDYAFVNYKRLSGVHNISVAIGL
ncbi:MAG: PorV/PorQ family protein [Melioribacteraceae bacterium]|nr:PorV/PorQ family protein [Melioribacteraceae bacterium]